MVNKEDVCTPAGCNLAIDAITPNREIVGGTR